MSRLDIRPMDHTAKLVEAEHYAAEHTERYTLDEVFNRQLERFIYSARNLPRFLV